MNPNGTTASPNHPLINFDKTQGGISEDLDDLTDQNDDVDDYNFGAGDGGLVARQASPSMADYTDRAMIDGGQWVNNGKGIRPDRLNTVLENGMTATDLVYPPYPLGCSRCRR